MRIHRQAHLARVVLAVVALGWPLAGGAQNTERDRRVQINREIQARTRIDTTFAFNKSGELSISVARGEIRVTAWARSDTRIVANSEAGTISMTASQDRVRLEMRPTVSGRARFDINVPIGVRVVATTNSGSIDVSGTQSDLTLRTVSGRISASDGAGNSRINTAAGRITLQRFSGETRIGTMTGPLSISEIGGELSLTTITAPTTIERADLANLTVEAAQGNFDFAGRLSPQGKHRIETFGGTVEFRFPSDFAATIVMESLNGKLHADVPVTLISRRDNNRGRASDSQQFTINGGGTLISISTLNGGVFLRRPPASERR